MALTRTLAQFREAVQRTADVVAFTDRHPAAYLNDLVNRGLGALHRLTMVVAPEFRPIASTTLTADGTNTTFALPAGFRSLISVEYADDDGEHLWLTPFEMHERAELYGDGTEGVRATHYRLMGSSLELLPLPPSGHTALVWYATTASQLASDSATADVLDRLDDFVIWWAAREVASERGDWERHDRLSAKLAAMEAEIQILARTRDMSAPARPVDVRKADRYGRKRAW